MLEICRIDRKYFLHLSPLTNTSAVDGVSGEKRLRCGGKKFTDEILCKDGSVGRASLVNDEQFPDSCISFNYTSISPPNLHHFFTLKITKQSTARFVLFHVTRQDKRASKKLIKIIIKSCFCRGRNDDGKWMSCWGLGVACCQQ